MDDAVHSAAGKLDRLLERVHCASDVFFESISYEDVIVLGIAVIGTGTRKVVDPAMCMVVAAGAARSIFAGCARGGTRSGCYSSGSLLSEEFRRAGYKSCHRRDLAKEIAPSVDSHRISPVRRLNRRGVVNEKVTRM